MTIGNALSDIHPNKPVLGLNENAGTNFTTSILESPSGLVPVALVLQQLCLQSSLRCLPLEHTCWFGVVFGYKFDPGLFVPTTDKFSIHSFPVLLEVSIWVLIGELKITFILFLS